MEEKIINIKGKPIKIEEKNNISGKEIAMIVFNELDKISSKQNYLEEYEILKNRLCRDNFWRLEE